MRDAEPSPFVEVFASSELISVGGEVAGHSHGLPRNPPCRLADEVPDEVPVTSEAAGREPPGRRLNPSPPPGPRSSLQRPLG